MCRRISSKYDQDIEKILKEKIGFSFKYFDRNDSDYCIDHCESVYFISLLDRLKDLSDWTVTRFQTAYNKTLRNHSVKWNDERVQRDSFGIPNEDEIVDKPWQFSVSANEDGRVVGFFIDNIFYIRWLDKNHYTYQ